MDADAAVYERALARLYRWIAASAILGTTLIFAAWGWRAAVAFALGAGASGFAFRWMHQAVDALGPGAKPTRKRVLILFALRYGVIGFGAYAIVKVFGMNGLAIVCGLFVPVAAVIAEIIYELANGT